MAAQLKPVPLLCGTLSVEIINAKGLKNKDVSTPFKKNLSDPFCRVSLDAIKICKTKTIDDDLNPEFNESNITK